MDLNKKGEGRSPLHLFTAEHITRLISQLTCRFYCVIKLIDSKGQSAKYSEILSTSLALINMQLLFFR